MITLLIPKISSDLEATPMQITIIVISYTLFKSLAMIILGNYYARSFSRILPMSFLLQGISSFLYFYAFSWEHILIIRLSQGIWSGIAWLSAQTLLASGSEKESLGKHFGIFYGASNFGFISGSALSGAFFKILDQYAMTFAFIAILYFVSTLISLFIKADTKPIAQPEIRKNIRKNYRLLLISMTHNGSVAFLNSIILIFAYEYLGFSVTSMAGIVMAAGVFGVLSRPVAGYLSDR
ncbi:MAG: MFS transporter [Theionarchaea archaeon]|nr:MFS transporter [Theionarchaea archaeon]